MNELRDKQRLSILQELDDNIRAVIIQNLGKNVSDLPGELEDLGPEYKDLLLQLFQEAYQNQSFIPEIRYELETYTNDLDPDFSERLIEKNQGKLIRILDIGAGPGDVTLRLYKRLVKAGLVPQIFALERSQRFRNQLVQGAKSDGIAAMKKEKILGTENYPGIFSIGRDIQDLRRETLGSIDLVIGNYVLDRVPQGKLVNDIFTSGFGNVQFTNCIPLQYENPNTGQLYIPKEEIIIPEGTEDLSAIGKALSLKDQELFSGINIVTSLQDGKEFFRFGGIRGEII